MKFSDLVENVQDSREVKFSDLVENVQDSREAEVMRSLDLLEIAVSSQPVLETACAGHTILD
jgi:hypothetical protein